jgi:hypothetical protein
MPPVRSLKSALTAAIAASLTVPFAGPAAFASPDDAPRRPVILDSQHGVNDGQSGFMWQTAPLSRQPIVSAQPMATPTELPPGSSVPIVVSPYIQLPSGGNRPPRPQPRLTPGSQ